MLHKQSGAGTPGYNRVCGQLTEAAFAWIEDVAPTRCFERSEGNRFCDRLSMPRTSLFGDAYQVGTAVTIPARHCHASQKNVGGNLGDSNSSGGGHWLIELPFGQT